MEFPDLWDCVPMRSLVLIVALAVLAIGGYFELKNGIRAADPALVAGVQAKLDSIPLDLGDWQGELQTPDWKQGKQAGAFALTTLVYTNKKLNQAVSVLILCGHAREMAVHEPTRCYAGAGYRLIGSQQRKTIDEDGSGSWSYWSSRFDTDTFPAISLQVNWCWSIAGDWAGPDDARTTFRGEPALYKLYVSRRLNTLGTPSSSGDPTEDFLKKFCPVVQKNLAGNTLSNPK
jgi:Protein of unknown function (DUF3485)